MTATSLAREHFATSRAADFLEVRSLEASTGAPAERFAEVLLKELVDNALDAAETVGCRPVVDVTVATTEDALTLTVADNGPGIPAEVVTRVLDFDVLVSDKARYRSPSRGQQGNALKTVVGIASVLGGRPVLIETDQTRHVVAAELVAGHVRVRHDLEPAPPRTGTAVTVTVDAADLEFDPRELVLGFALANPHVSIRLDVGPVSTVTTGRVEPPVSYTATAPEGWSKVSPVDAGSPWWYDVEALTGLVLAYADAADLPLGEFVRKFRGLTGTAAAKQVTAAVPGVARLSGLVADPRRVRDLHAAMRARAKPPKPAALGPVGAEHLRAVLDTEHGVVGERFWYRRTEVADDGTGAPWLVEAAVAETADGRASTYYAMNHSPAPGDLLARTPLSCNEFDARGVGGFLTRAGLARFGLALVGAGLPSYAAAVHLVCPAPRFLDRGKTQLEVPPAVAEAVSSALWAVTRTAYREHEAARKDAARAQRAHQQRAEQAARTTREPSLADAVFAVIPAAVAHVSGDGALPYSARTLYYAVRPLAQQHTSRELTQSYFGTVLAAYQREHGELPGLYYDPRGWLYEPHQGQAVPLGTLDVAAYRPTPWCFDKLLYVEKKGFRQVLQAARLGERFDMAVMMGEGYATEAARVLAARVSHRHGFRVFVLHDADPAGYNIARTLAHATARMPEHHIEVVDLGLSIADALELGLESEEFTRSKELPTRLSLDDTERAWFTGRPLGRGRWAARRVELNAFSGPGLVAYIERKLTEHGADTKVTPPDDVLDERAQFLQRSLIRDRVDELMNARFDVDAMTEQLIAEFAPAPPERLPEQVADLHARARDKLWDTAVSDAVALDLHRADRDLEARFDALLGEQLDGRSEP